MPRTPGSAPAGSPPAGAGGRTRGPADFFVLSTDMLCIAGVDGHFKTLNPVWGRVLGYTEDELLSRPYVDFVHPDDREATLAEAGKIASGFPTIRFRNRYRCKDGSYKWLDWTATAAMVDGTIFASARDVTLAVAAAEEHEQQLREHAAKEARVKNALADGGPAIVFQPIVSIGSREVQGFEALSRFSAPPTQPPDVWFRDAAEVGMGEELELCAVANAVESARHLPAGTFVSINVSPSTVISEGFEKTIAGLPGHRVVIEVTEHAAVLDGASLRQAVDRLRARGVRLAIDDAGAGHSGLNQIVQLEPDFIKLDIFLTHNIDSDGVKRALATALVNFAREVGSTLIAEGVETPAELRALADLGIEQGQGYLLGRPQASPLTSEAWSPGASRRRRGRGLSSEASRSGPLGLRALSERAGIG